MGDETQTYRPIYDTRASDGAVYADNAVVGVTLDGVFTSKAEQDDWGRVTKKNLTTTGSTTPLLSEEYSYLDVAVGFETRLTTMVQLLTRKVKGVTKDTLRYTYDNNGNITAIRNGPGTEYYAKYTYDGLNQLTREDNAVLGKSWVFAYDTAGNILSKKEYAYTTGTLGAILDTKTYTYAATGWKDRLTSFNGEAIAYDALGNPTTYRGHALTWGKIRQLESYRIDSNTLLTFAYDASGLRTRKNSVVYQYDGEKIFVENRNSTILSYFYDMGGICGFEYNNVRYYYEKNLQGDITAVYDENGNKKAEYQYDAWGNHTTVTDVDGIGTLNPFRYRGYYYDTETGLYYLNSRYYDPQTGRFINADSIIGANGDIIGYNMFAYCSNNPIVFCDKTGHFVGTISGGIGGGLIGGIFGWAQGQDFWKSAAIGAITGAISGLGVDIATVTAGTGILVSAFLGALANLVGDMLTEVWINGRSWEDFKDPDLWKKIAIDAGIGALFGTVAGGIGKGVAAAFGDKFTGTLIRRLISLLGSETGEIVVGIIFGNAFVSIPQIVATETTGFLMENNVVGENLPAFPLRNPINYKNAGDNKSINHFYELYE